MKKKTPKRSRPAKRTRASLSESSDSSSNYSLQIDECSSLSSQVSDCEYSHEAKKQRICAINSTYPEEEFQYGTSDPLTSSTPLYHIDLNQTGLYTPLVNDNLYCPYHPYASPEHSQCPWHATQAHYHGNHWLSGAPETDNYLIDYLSDVTNSSPQYCYTDTGCPDWCVGSPSDCSLFGGLLSPFDGHSFMIDDIL